MLANKLQIKYPVIQAPMAGGIVDSDFVALVSNFGMLGSIPSGYLSLKNLKSFIKEVKTKTKNSFQVNIFVDYNDYSGKYKKPKELINAEKKIGCYKSDFFDVEKQPTIDEVIRLIIEQKVPIISTTFGILNSGHIQILRQNNILIMTTINSVGEVDTAITAQCSDVIIFQNQCAGGHSGGFIDGKYNNTLDIGLIRKQYKNANFIESGGIVNKGDIKRSIFNGYDGVQIGSGFLMTKESLANDLYKNKLLDVCDDKQVMHTTNITGKKAKGVKNKIALLGTKENLGYPLMQYATRELRAFAKANNIVDYQALWAGNGVTNISNTPPITSYMKSLI
jgi:nitronate monooxygenase